MKYLKRFWMFLALLLITSIAVFAQQDTTITALTKITVPTGFDWWYVVFFAVGMVIHYGSAVVSILGWNNFVGNFFKNFIGWFANKFHYTLLAGCLVTVGAFVSQYGLTEILKQVGITLSFATINVFGIAITLICGFLGDLANKGNIS